MREESLIPDTDTLTAQENTKATLTPSKLNLPSLEVILKGKKKWSMLTCLVLSLVLLMVATPFTQKWTKAFCNNTTTYRISMF